MRTDRFNVKVYRDRKMGNVARSASGSCSLPSHGVRLALLKSCMTKWVNVMKKAMIALGSAAVALGMVLTTALPASAQTVPGYKKCSSNQQYGVTTALNGAGATSSTATVHTLGGVTYPTYYGFGPKSTSKFGVSSGSYEVYTPSPATFNSVTGFCMPKGS